MYRSAQIEHKDVLRIRIGQQCRESRWPLLLHTPHTPGKRLESGFLYIGNPVKQARPLKPAEIAFLKTSADNYVLLKDEYLQETS